MKFKKPTHKELAIHLGVSHQAVKQMNKQRVELMILGLQKSKEDNIELIQQETNIQDISEYINYLKKIYIDSDNTFLLTDYTDRQNTLWKPTKFFFKNNRLARLNRSGSSDTLNPFVEKDIQLHLYKQFQNKKPDTKDKTSS